MMCVLRSLGKLDLFYNIPMSGYMKESVFHVIFNSFHSGKTFETVC